jgi:site-specific recombinase XerD
VIDADKVGVSAKTYRVSAAGARLDFGNQGLLVLLLDLGLHVSEAVDLQVSDFDQNSGKLVVYSMKME